MTDKEKEFTIDCSFEKPNYNFIFTVENTNDFIPFIEHTDYLIDPKDLFKDIDFSETFNELFT